MKWPVVLACAVFLTGGSLALAGENPDAKLAMHLVASDEYLYCDDLAPATVFDITDELTIAELAASGYCGYVLFLAYDLGSCIHCMEYFVTGWPMGRGAPFITPPTYCADILVLGQPFEVYGGDGGLGCFVGMTCLGDPVTHMAPFAYSSFDVSEHTSYLPIVLNYSPSSYGYPTDPHNYVLGPYPPCEEDPVVEEHGCVIGTGVGLQSIQLVAPNGGETWYACATPPIEWVATGVANVRLDYTTNGGSTWHDIIASTPSTRFFLWTVPNEPSSDCLVRISDAEDGFPSDVSQVSFTIAYEFARVIHVPAEAPTIQYAVYLAAPSDTIVVASGSYNESVRMKENLTLRSEYGPEKTTIDAAGHLHGVVFDEIGSDSRIEGFTITGGDASGTSAEEQTGGGILFTRAGGAVANCIITGNRSSLTGGGIGASGPRAVTITDCVVSENISESGGGLCPYSDDATLINTVIIHNTATGNGGGVYCHNCSPTLTNCAIVANSGSCGGGMYCATYADPLIRNCTFAFNSSPCGAALSCNYISSPILVNTIISYSEQGEAVHCYYCSYPVIFCCDLFGNKWGDGCVEAQIGSEGNFSEKPLFCDPAEGCFKLQACSPCVEGYGCGQIGAYGVGCACGGEPSRVERTTWSRVKSLFRE